MNYRSFKVKIPKNLPDNVRKAIATEIIDHVIDRTQQKNQDKNGTRFPSYSDSYKNSFEFIFKSSSSPDLTLSGEMLNSMELVKDSDGELEIGYSQSANDDLLGKVEGNVRGSYGQPTGNRSKARNFLGIEKDELTKILNKYKDETASIRAEIINDIGGLTVSALDFPTSKREAAEIDITETDNVKSFSILKNKSLLNIFTLVKGEK